MVSCCWSVVSAAQASQRPCLHQLHVLCTALSWWPFASFSIGLCLFPTPSLPLIYQCGKCLVLLLWGLMAKRRGFSTWQGGKTGSKNPQWFTRRQKLIRYDQQARLQSNATLAKEHTRSPAISCRSCTGVGKYPWPTRLSLTLPKWCLATFKLITNNELGSRCLNGWWGAKCNKQRGGIHGNPVSRYVKGVLPSANRRYTKRVPLLSNMVK